MPTKLTIPISEADIRALRVGDSVLLDGVMVTGRDAAHKYLMEKFVRPAGPVPESEKELYEKLKELLAGGVIYHCGPVVKKLPDGKWSFVAAGPTTSIREEPYQADVIGHFGLRAVIGKGGMAAKTLEGCQKYGAVYLHAIGGAATLIAERVKEVLTRLQEGRVRHAGGVLGDSRPGFPGGRHDGRARQESARRDQSQVAGKTVRVARGLAKACGIKQIKAPSLRRRGLVLYPHSRAKVPAHAPDHRAQSRR